MGINHMHLVIPTRMGINHMHLVFHRSKVDVSSRSNPVSPTHTRAGSLQTSSGLLPAHSTHHRWPSHVFSCAASLSCGWNLQFVCFPESFRDTWTVLFLLCVPRALIVTLWLIDWLIVTLCMLCAHRMSILRMFSCLAEDYAFTMTQVNFACAPPRALVQFSIKYCAR